MRGLLPTRRDRQNLYPETWQEAWVKQPLDEGILRSWWPLSEEQNLEATDKLFVMRQLIHREANSGHS